MINAIVRNFISNAIKFTEFGRITIMAIKNSSNTLISVIYTGVGIISDKLNNIFGVMSSKSTLGTREPDLGLIICKELIEKNGGSIWAKSEQGKGSSF